MAQAKKLPGSKGAAKAKKHVRRAPNPHVIPKKVETRFAAPDHISWRFSMLDVGGPWNCHAMDASCVASVLEKLRAIESMRLSEILGPKAGGKLVAAGGVCAEAQRRLEELKLDDTSHLFEFHLSGLWRVWAIQVDTVFHLLWWDPDHTVWPSVLKHT